MMEGITNPQFRSKIAATPPTTANGYSRPGVSPRPPVPSPSPSPSSSPFVKNSPSSAPSTPRTFSGVQVNTSVVNNNTKSPSGPPGRVLPSTPTSPSPSSTPTSPASATPPQPLPRPQRPLPATATASPTSTPTSAPTTNSPTTVVPGGRPLPATQRPPSRPPANKPPPQQPPPQPIRVSPVSTPTSTTTPNNPFGSGATPPVSPSSVPPSTPPPRPPSPTTTSPAVPARPRYVPKQTTPLVLSKHSPLVSPQPSPQASPQASPIPESPSSSPSPVGFQTGRIQPTQPQPGPNRPAFALLRPTQSPTPTSPIGSPATNSAPSTPTTPSSTPPSSTPPSSTPPAQPPRVMGRSATVSPATTAQYSKPLPKQPPRPTGAPVPTLVHHQSSPNLPRGPPPRPAPPRSQGAVAGVSAEDQMQRNASMPSLSRHHSMQSMSDAPPKKGPAISPRRVQSSTASRVPLMERLTPQDTAAIIRVQSYVRGWIRRKKFRKLVKDNIHRTKVVKELLSSEENYVEGLKVINKTYLEQLTWNAKVSPNPLLTSDQINSIFSTVAGITTFNTTLLEKLRERVNNWATSQVIGDVFLTMAPFLKLYTTYCTNYDHAIQTLVKAKKEPNFATFLETCLKTTTHTLESLLITVVQRIPRYILLLQDFIKHTWPEHVDYENISNALKSVQDIANKLNKGIGQAESLNKVVALQSAIVGMEEVLVTPSRIFVREGPIAECSLEAKAGKEIENHWYFLFNDSLVVTERKKDEKYQFRSFVDFTADTSMKIKDVPDNLVQNAFQIVSPTLSLFLSCQDAATKAAILDMSKQVRDQIAHRRALTMSNGENLASDISKSLPSIGVSLIGSELTVSIPRTETCKDGKKEYTLYHTKIRDDKTKKGTIISKRYSEFDQLHKALKKLFPDMDFMDLPKKHLVGSLSKETVESRRVMLEMYLQALVQRPEIRSSPVFIEFIQGYTAPPSSSKKGRKLIVSSNEG